MPVYSYKTKSRNRWMFKISIDGLQILRRGYHSRIDAVKSEAFFISMYNSKVSITTYNILIDSYLEYVSQSVKPTNLYNISHTIGKHIREHIPDKRVYQLKYVHFSSCRKYVLKSNYEKKNDLFSILRQIFVFCHIIYGYNC